MEYTVKVRSTAPILMHNIEGMDPTYFPEAQTQLKAITSKRGNNRTEADDKLVREISCQLSLYLDEENNPTIPPRVFRSVIEAAARTVKQGTLVRQGLQVLHHGVEFIYDKEKYGTTIEELRVNTQFNTPVNVQKNKIIRTRAKFDDWECVFKVLVYEDMVDEQKLTKWIEDAGRFIGIGDWNPKHSGSFGTFELVSID